MQYIVTVKIKSDPFLHDPRNKVTGSCPAHTGHQCTDVTGAHHSFLHESEYSVLELQALYSENGVHVTRIEEV